MIPGWLAEAADIFWDSAGDPPPFPRELYGVLPYALPVHQHIMPRLGIDGVDEWLQRHGVGQRLSEPDRRLRGCLVALRGRGIIFVDGGDSDAERRFTLAHEAGHFLLDYYMPRARAQALLGPDIVPVLDGDRAPRSDERLVAAVRNCPLGIHVHLLDRRRPNAVISRSENRADRFAWELLAPDADLERRYDRRLTDEQTITRDLEQVYGLPAAEAAAYAEQWLGERVRPSNLVFLRQ
jgi:hypothetical protein